MTGKKLYDKYAGKSASYEGVKGIVCGYHDIPQRGKSSSVLIMSIDNGFVNKTDIGWLKTGFKNAVIVVPANNSRYIWISEEDIID